MKRKALLQLSALDVQLYTGRYLGSQFNTKT